MSEDQELLSLRLNSIGSVEELGASQSKEEYIRGQADNINQAIINNDLKRVKQIMAHLRKYTYMHDAKIKRPLYCHKQANHAI